MSNVIIGKFFNDLHSTGKLITEEDKTSGSMYITGPFAQADVLNNNKRVYPKTVLDTAMEEFINTMVSKDLAVSELGHPDSPKINLDKVCCKIVHLYSTGDNWIGKAKVLDTPCGAILKGLIQGGVRCGASTRGLGAADQTQWKNEDCNLVNQFTLRAIDVVHSPSGPDCYVDAVMEAKDWILDNANGKVYELNEETYKHFESRIKNLPAVKKNSDTQVFNAVKFFLNSLR